MKRSEWLEIVKLIRANWPQSPIPDESIAVWFTDVQDLPVEEARAALHALCRDGREFPPNGGQIRAKVQALAMGHELDHGAAWQLAMDSVRKFGSASEDEALDWLADRSAITAEAVRRFGYRDLCLCDLDDLGTIRAQFRDIFKAVKGAAERDERYSGLPAVRPKRLSPRPIRELVAEVRELEPGR